MTVKADLVIRNTSQVLTLQGPAHARSGKDMSALGVIPRGAVAVFEGRIAWVGNEADLPGHVVIQDNAQVVDAAECAVLPGFVDSHTHLVFGGSREDEFARKIAGVPYMQIAAEGGGIRRTVRDTRNASADELFTSGFERICDAFRFGITTVDIKSGYGLDFDTEMKMLRVARHLGEATPMDVVTTFLGAHEIPSDRKKQDYLDEVCDVMIPYVAQHGLAEFCDVFCEKGVYSVEEAERVLRTGQAHGLLPRLHADQMTSSGGAELAARIGAISADHIDRISPEGIRAMSRSDVMGVLLPGSVFFLGFDQYAPARELIDSGVPVAIATNFNPGSSMSMNIHLMMTIACIKQRMTIPETITATTFNAACAIRRESVAGSLSPGKKADIVILDCPHPEMIPYHFGHNHVRHVFCGGRPVVEDGRVLPF